MDGKVRKIKLYNINIRNKADSNKLNCSDDKLCKSDDNLNKVKKVIDDKNQITSSRLNKNYGKPSIFSEAKNNEKRNAHKNFDINNIKKNTILASTPKISNKINTCEDNKIFEDGKILNSNNNTSDTNLINNKIHNNKKISSLITKIMKSNTDNIINLITKIDKSSPNTNSSYKNTIIYQKGDDNYTNLIKTEKKNNKTASTVSLNSNLKSSRKESNIDVNNYFSESNMQNEKILHVGPDGIRNNYLNLENNRQQLSFLKKDDKFIYKLESLNFSEKICNGNSNDILTKDALNDKDFYNKSNSCKNEDVSLNCKELLKIMSKYQLLTVEKFIPECFEISNKEKINNLNGELDNLKKETFDLYMKLKESSEENKLNLESQKAESFQSVKYNLNIIGISSDRRMSFYKNCFDLCLESLKEIKNNLSSCKPQSNYESKNSTNIIENNVVINNNENCGNNLNLNLNLNLNSISPTNTNRNPRNKVTKIIEIKKFKKKQMSFKKFRKESFDNSMNSSDSMISEGIKVKLPYFNYFVNKPKEYNLKFKKLSRKFTYKKINFNFNKNKIEVPKSNSISQEFECISLNETIILKENENDFQKRFELKDKMRLRSKSVLNVDFRNIEKVTKKEKLKKEKFLLNDDSVAKVILKIYFIDF